MNCSQMTKGASATFSIIDDVIPRFFTDCPCISLHKRSLINGTGSGSKLLQTTIKQRNRLIELAGSYSLVQT